MNSLNEIARFLMSRDKFVILTHQYPDGDTLGSAFALCRALHKLGKKARVIVNGVLANKFAFMKEGMEEQTFDYETVVAVDIASMDLLGSLQEEFGKKVDAAIDHHAMNNPFAKYTHENPQAAANAENILELIKLMGVKIDKKIADCLYTGLCTDTGCFKFSNVTPSTMRMAAELMELGCDSALINRVMFDTKSMARIRIESAALGTLAMYCSNRIAVIYTSMQMEKEAGVSESDTDGLAALPRQIEGVIIGITIKEKQTGKYKVSVRTIDGYNAAEICRTFGGGGHHAAAGCSLNGTLEEVREKLVTEAEKVLCR